MVKMSELEAAASSEGFIKRSIGHSRTGKPSKRRARYVLQACHACKRRKGRCDGQQPCQHCRKRGVRCQYPNHPQLSSSDDQYTPGGSRAENPTVVTLNSEDVQSIQDSILSLQKLLDRIATRINHQARNEPTQASTLSPPQQENRIFETQSSFATHREPASFPENDRIDHSNLRFHGSSSSDYSLNIAQILLRHKDGLDVSIGSASHQTASSFGAMTVTTADLYNNAAWGCGDVFHQPLATSCTVPVHRLLSKVDALRLLRVYQEVVGDLYPILDMQSLYRQLERLYVSGGVGLGLRRCNSSHVDDHHILVLNLVCSIALRAETAGTSKVAEVLYESVQSSIEKIVIRQKIQVRNVVLVLLAVCYKHLLPKMGNLLKH
ncbi:hypothetical protein GGI43DRAFT_418918, partial [Trichoderma evansii]